ncbi:FkbM family methyltransferase [Kosakonia oryziphila]|uniref:Methyltransferase, FkbM family n=1 Tax=Kosakonia oryziphila TaxID=1005667 RepID=A0A1C4GEP5_9ENTR|nr:FkbM family methyltransferase [Kosakonia oryziphila]SCC66670.1 methyltransferase, FkbM family [Kosakonia oryziphila]
MSILEKICESKNHFIDTIAEMQQNGRPLVLCGAGYLGQKTWEFLTSKGVKVDYVAVNEKYFTEGAVFYGYNIINLDRMTERDDTYNYILAIQYVSEELEAMLRKNAESILIFDHSFIGVNTDTLYTLEFCQENEPLLTEFYNSLGDEKSKETLVAFINQRICARSSYYGKYFDPNHYLAEDLVRLQDDEVYVDCGAYDGDSVLAFLKAAEKQGVKKPAKILAFEPEEKNFELLKNANIGDVKLTAINKGVWSENTTLRFDSGMDTSSRLSEGEGNTSIDVISIDNALGGSNHATFIKMDIEGAELEALKGAQQTIRASLPVLTISLYHKPEDLITIPQYIRELSDDYRFYLRGHHPALAFELVLYALPSKRVVL